MSPIFTWTITQMQCLAQADGHTDVVIVAHWQCTGEATDGGEPYSSSCSGSSSFTLDSLSTFTPYDQLTQTQVLGWVWQEPGLKQTIEDNVSVQLERQINPPVSTPDLPWAAA